MKRFITLVFCIEKGLLEQQAKLLIESLVKLSVDLKFQFIAFSPRVDFYPTKDTCDFLAEKQVIHIKENINTKFLDYPIANKVLACEYVEENFPQFKSLLFVDTDTVFLKPIDNNLLSCQNKLLLRPVDNKGPGSLGLDDENDKFWLDVFSLFKINAPLASLETTVRTQLIRPYYNAGFIWANGLPGFFAQWKKDFVKLVNSGLRPYGYKSRDNTDFRCLDQVALAVTAQRFNDNIKILPQTYNYPIPFRPMMKGRKNHPQFNELVHVHYHKWFAHPGFLDYVTNEEEKKSEQYLWLKDHLPLFPTIGGPFKC